MDHSKFRRSSNVEQQSLEEFMRDQAAVSNAIPDQYNGLAGAYIPNYPVEASQAQLNNPMAQSMGIRDILALLLRNPQAIPFQGEAAPFDQRFPGPGDLPTRGSSTAPLPRPDPRYR